MGLKTKPEDVCEQVDTSAPVFCKTHTEPYIKEDGLWYSKNHEGTEKLINSSAFLHCHEQIIECDGRVPAVYYTTNPFNNTIGLPFINSFDAPFDQQEVYPIVTSSTLIWDLSTITNGPSKKYNTLFSAKNKTV